MTTGRRAYVERPSNETNVSPRATVFIAILLLLSGTPGSLRDRFLFFAQCALLRTESAWLVPAPQLFVNRWLRVRSAAGDCWYVTTRCEGLTWNVIGGGTDLYEVASRSRE